MQNTATGVQSRVAVSWGRVGVGARRWHRGVLGRLAARRRSGCGCWIPLV